MSFLNPFFLVGSLALIVPIFIHLVRREKSEVIRFGSLMFLLRVPTKTIRQQWFRNLLLLVFRLLLIAVLVAAFARPYLTGLEIAKVSDEQASRTVLLVDNSYSMTYGTNFERMQVEAQNRIGAMNPGDRMALIVFDENPNLLTMPTEDTAELKELVESLNPSADKTNYYKAFVLADRILSGLEEYNRKLILISDFQRNGWNRSSRQSLIDMDVEIEFVDLSIENSENVGIESVRVDSKVFTRSYTGQVTARINNYKLGDAVTIPISININDREVGKKTVTIPFQSAAVVEFTGFDLPLGFSRGRIQIEIEDPLTIDNEFFFTIERREKMKVLIIDSGRSRQSFFLEQALTSVRELPFAVTTRRMDNLNIGELESYEVVIVNDVKRMANSIKIRLGELRDLGQGQLFFLGENADLEWWNSLEDFPVTLSEKVFIPKGRDQSSYSMTSYDRNHAIFIPIEKSKGLTLSTVQFFAYIEMQAKGATAVIAKFENGSIAVAEHANENKVSLVVASSVDNNWNDLPLKPSFLPLIHEMVLYLARYRDMAPWYELGQAVPVVKGSNENVVLVLPNGLRRNLSDSSGTRKQLFVPESRGFYEIRAGRDTEEVAVNIPSSESELTKIQPDDLMSSVKRMHAESATNGLFDEADNNLFRQQNWWWYLFLIALLLGIGEIYLGNRISAIGIRKSTTATG